MQTLHGNGSHPKKSSHRLAGISSMVGVPPSSGMTFLFMVQRRH